MIKCFTIYLLTSTIAFFGVVFGRCLIKSDGVQSRDFMAALARFDGLHYKNIVTEGYTYDPAKRSEVAFFPTYPAVASVLRRMTGIDPVLSLLVTSNVFLAGSFLVFEAYLRGRRLSGRYFADGRANYPGVTKSANGRRDLAEDGDAQERGRWQSQNTVYTTLLLFGLLPPTFFFRMAYSESAFLFFCILSFYAMQRRWPLAWIAVIVGLTTACRPVGVALLLPFVAHLQRSSPRKWQRVARCLTLLPLACWGIAVFMLFQYIEFRDAFAFVRVQSHWAFRVPTSALDKGAALLSLEPVWLTYDATCPQCFWRNYPPPCPFFNWQFMNPIYFLSAALLVAIGARRRWLTSGEVLLSAGLLAIPYFTKAYEYGMNSHGRFAAAVFPVYLVAGRLLSALPDPLAAAVLALSAFFMGAYASMFAAGYQFF